MRNGAGKPTLLRMLAGLHDEPANHLGLPAIEQLVSALDEYPGTFLLVTHDRGMLESVSVTRRLVAAGGQVAEVDVT